RSRRRQDGIQTAGDAIHGMPHRYVCELLSQPAPKSQPESCPKGKPPMSSSTELPASLSRLYARPGFLLRRAHQISAAVFEDACRELALTPAQFGVLTVLQSHPGLGQSSLARALGFDKVTVLRVLRGLEARGLVAREPAEDNRRNVSVSLTGEGDRLL